MKLSWAGYFLILFLCLIAGISLSFADEGGLPGVFLNYGAGPRSLGMGKAFAAVADDAQAVYFNPGGLFQLNSHEVLLAHSQLYGARMEYIAYTLPTKELGAFGVGILNYGAEGLDSRTPENWQYQPTLFAENAYLVSYAYNPFRFMGFGGTAKLVTKNLAQYADVGLGADFGLLARAGNLFRFGLVVQNAVEPVLTLHTLSDRYPRTFRLGAAVVLLDGRIVMSADLTSPLLRVIDETDKNPTNKLKLDLTAHGGVEFEIVPDVVVQRVGIDGNEISFGLGVHRNWGKMSLGVDYAFLLHHRSEFRLTPTHKIGVFIDFSGFRVWIDAQPKLFSPTPEDKNNVLWMDTRTISRAPVKRWQVIIKNSFGEVVRSYSGWDTPPPRMWWDGLDDVGRLVSDGRYYYEIVVVDQHNSSLSFSGFLTTVKTRGPQGKVEIKHGE
ncbi:MAG: hypothetical protein ACUVWQ_03835 [Candidatus Aminicenantales bacterium]